MTIRTSPVLLRSRPIRVLRRAICLLAVPGIVSVADPTQAQTKQDPEYVAGFSAWQQERYPVASDHLSRYRINVAYGKSYDVDYLLGTSWCRMDGLLAKGASLLDWAMQQDMPASAARQFAIELQRCRAQLAQGTAPTQRPESLARTSVGAGASVRASGKLYYVVNGEKGAFAAYPLDLVRPRPELEYEQRVFPLTQTEAALGATRARLGANFRVIAVDRFVLASKHHTDTQLRDIAARLASFVAFLKTEYGIEYPASYVTVNLCATPQDLVTLAMDVHGLRASPLTLGYTFQNDLSMSAVMQGTAAGTLLHELFHLGVRSNFGDIPSWLDESMASLYETSTDVRGRYWGDPNWRGGVLRFMGGGDKFTLGHLVGYLSADRILGSGAPTGSMGDSDEGTYEAAVGRYFALYLQEQGVLSAVYNAFRDRPTWTSEIPAKAASIRLIEGATGRAEAALQTEFKDWLRVAINSPTMRLPGREGGVVVPKEIPSDFTRSPDPGSALPTTLPASGSVADQVIQRR